MAKNIYIGVDNVARKVKQPYIGIDNIARKVKSGFIGVDNVARQYYESVVYNTWKKYNIIGATFSNSYFSDVDTSSNRNDTTTISVDNTVQDPIPFSCTSASPVSLSMDYYDGCTISSATLEKGATTSHISGYQRWSDKDYHNDKLVRLKFAMTDLYPSDSRRDMYYYIFPGFVPVNDCLYWYHSSGQLMRAGRRLVPNIDSITLVRYKYTKDNDGDSSETIRYYTLSSASAVSTIVAPQGTYPDCDVHSDGCIYIKQ